MTDTDIARYLSRSYTTVLKRDEDGDIVATIAELDGCVAHGRDESEALQNLREAQEAWLEAALATGQDIPAPEIEEDLPSGKFVVRLPRSLHRKLNRLAKKDDVSLNQVMVMAAAEHLARRETREEFRSHAHRAEWPVLGWQKEDRLKKPMAKIGPYMESMQKQGVMGKEQDEHFPSKEPRGARKG